MGGLELGVVVTKSDCARTASGWWGGLELGVVVTKSDCARTATYMHACMHACMIHTYMIQCSVCAIWFHTECVDIKKDTPVGVWPCLACRQIPTKISDIAAALGSMEQLVASVRTISEQLVASERARQDDRIMIIALRSEIITLKEKVANLTWRTFRQPNQPSSLLIDSSLIRDKRVVDYGGHRRQ